MLRAHRSFAFGLIVALLVCSAACDGAATESTKASAPPPGEHTWTTADGNTIPYSVAGKADADVTVVLIHCWMCDRSFWKEQLPALAGSYRTVTLDLPGHGKATAEREEWTVAGYGEDVAGLIGELDLSDVVLVGHSMGGPVSLRAAALSPGRVRGIVAVDTLHDAEFKYEGDQVDGIMKAFETDFVGTCQRFVKMMFPEEGVDELIEHVRSVGCNAAHGEAGTALMRDFGEIDMAAWFRDAGVPIRAINAATPTPTRVESNRKYADFDAKFIQNVGHYLHMTRPDEFNALMLEAIGGFAGRS